MRRGTQITLNRREIQLLRKKLTTDAEWDFDDVETAGNILRKLRDAEEGQRRLGVKHERKQC